MFNRRRLLFTFFVTCAINLLAPVVCFSQEFTDKDMVEINSYVLTGPGLEKVTQATQNLGLLRKQMSSRCEDREGTKSLDEWVAQTNAITGTEAAIKSAGISTREYLVFFMSLAQNGVAAWVISQPGGVLPQGASMANVDFYLAHEAEVQILTQQTEPDECDGDDDHNDDSTEATSDSQFVWAFPKATSGLEAAVGLSG